MTSGNLSVYLVSMWGIVQNVRILGGVYQTGDGSSEPKILSSIRFARKNFDQGLKLISCKLLALHRRGRLSG
jgi:hypothetical protein